MRDLLFEPGQHLVRRLPLCAVSHGIRVQAQFDAVVRYKAVGQCAEKGARQPGGLQSVDDVLNGKIECPVGVEAQDDHAVYFLPPSLPVDSFPCGQS